MPTMTPRVVPRLKQSVLFIRCAGRRKSFFPRDRTAPRKTPFLALFKGGGAGATARIANVKRERPNTKEPRDPMEERSAGAALPSSPRNAVLIAARKMEVKVSSDAFFLLQARVTGGMNEP